MTMRIVKKTVCPGMFQFYYCYNQNRIKAAVILMFILTSGLALPGTAGSSPLKAGVAKVNITYWESGGIVKDSAYARALVLDNGSTKAVIISVDAIDVGPFISNVRRELKKDLNIEPANVMINASHLAHCESRLS